MSPMRKLRERYDVVAREAAKFGVVGAINTVLDFVVLNLLVFGLGLPPLRSKVGSTVVATTSSYLMNRHWTFRHRERQNVRREYTLFFALNAVGLGISLATIGFVRYGLGQEGALWLNGANVVAIIFGTLFRFWSYRRFVWLSPAAVEEAAADGDMVAAAVLDIVEHELAEHERPEHERQPR
ncbi:MAG TPA: GtrA family protein [Mycobacteriales bacterium]|nr:GtrA family protein [Mycobacteriales bacterium]